MSVLYGCVVQFPQLIEEGWGREAVNDGIERMFVHHLFSS